MKIVKGRTKAAPKTMLYGLPSSGKSSLAATLPDALFLDIEGGLSFLDVTKTPVTTADELMSDLFELLKAPKQEYKYIVIDSVDWLVRLFVAKTAGSGQGKTLEQLMNSATLTLNKSQGGYGSGKQVLENYIRDVFIKFMNMLNRNGYGIVLIAHADRKTLLDADGVNIERLAPKMDLNSMAALIEWVDNLFYLKSDDDGTRHLIVNPTDAISAKNRIGIKEDDFVVDDNFDFESLMTTGKAQKARNTNKG